MAWSPGIGLCLAAGSLPRNEARTHCVLRVGSIAMMGLHSVLKRGASRTQETHNGRNDQFVILREVYPIVKTKISLT